MDEVNWSNLPPLLLETHIWPMLDYISFLSSLCVCKPWYWASLDCYSLEIHLSSSSQTRQIQMDQLERITTARKSLRSFIISSRSGLRPSVLDALSKSSGSTIMRLSMPFCEGLRMEEAKWQLARLFPVLQDLDLRGWKIPKSAITSSVFPKTLKSLSLSSCHTIVDESLEILSTLVSGLTHLDLRGVYRLTDKGVGSILKANPSITSLDLSSLMNLTDAALIGAGVACPKMSKFVARGVNFTDFGIEQVGKAWGEGLKSLSMKMCPRLSESAICNVLLPALPNLTLLDLQKANLSMESPILNSLISCPKLTSLDLQDCTQWQLNSTDLQVFLSSCSYLSYIYLRSPVVHDKHLDIIGQSTPRLVGLYMQECHGLTPNGVVLFLDYIQRGFLPLLNRVILSDIPTLCHNKDLNQRIQLCRRTNITIGKKIATHETE